MLRPILRVRESNLEMVAGEGYVAQQIRRREVPAAVGNLRPVRRRLILRRRRVEALGAQSDLARNMSLLCKQGSNTPLNLNEMSHYASIVASLGGDATKAMTGPNAPGLLLRVGFSKKRPDLANGGLRFSMR